MHLVKFQRAQVVKFERAPTLTRLKRDATQRFVELVEANTTLGPRRLEHVFGIGESNGSEGSGIIWCAYRRGARAMALKTVEQRIRRAVFQRLLTAQQAEELIGEISARRFAAETAAVAADTYVYDPLRAKVREIEKTALALAEQIGDLTKLGNSYDDTLKRLVPLRTTLAELELNARNRVVPVKQPPPAPDEAWLADVERKYGKKVPATAVRKLLGPDHGLPLRDGHASAKAVAKALGIKLAALREEALDEMKKL